MKLMYQVRDYHPELVEDRFIGANPDHETGYYFMETGGTPRRTLRVELASDEEVPAELREAVREAGKPVRVPDPESTTDPIQWGMAK